jgi:hypothetical protein
VEGQRRGKAKALEVSLNHGIHSRRKKLDETSRDLKRAQKDKKEQRKLASEYKSKLEAIANIVNNK